VGDWELQKLSEVVRSGQIAQGQMVSDFEQSLSQKVGTSGAVACSSGTAALHLALLGMNVGAEDEVIFPSYVCTALLYAVRYVGATPVLAEIDPETQNLDPVDVKKRITSKTKAMIVPHLFGLPADMKRLVSLEVPVIEDCAQALGAGSEGEEAGSMAHAAIFSFYATKMICTGEGGMVASNDKDFLERARDLREYDQKKYARLRYNYKMTDMQASMGIAQLEQLEDFIQRRREVAKTYDRAFADVPAQLPPKREGHIYYRYVIRLREKADPVIRALQEMGVGADRPVYKPIHRYLGMTGFPKTEEVWERSLSVPIYPSLRGDEIHRIEEAVPAAFMEKSA
jgi:dTDP-4-amino-4,6-dideoxygalactose transaminase